MSEETKHEVSEVSEVSLRDLYAVLYRWRKFLLVFPLALAAVVLLACLVWPKTFSSKAVVAVVSRDTGAGILTNLPSVAVLTNSFKQLLTTTALTQFDEKTLESFETKFEDKQGLWTLKAGGGSPSEAKTRSEALFVAAQNFLTERSLQIINTNITTTLAQARVDLESQRDTLKKLREAMTDKTAPNISSAVVAATLEGASTEPLSARAINPGAANLSLDESKVRSGIAQAVAGIAKLEALQKNPEQLKTLLGQSLRLEVLVAPAEPRRQDFPRPALFTAIAFVLGLLGALVWAFLSEALRVPVPRGV